MVKVIEVSLDIFFGVAALSALALGAAIQAPRILVGAVKQEIEIYRKKS